MTRRTDRDERHRAMRREQLVALQAKEPGRCVWLTFYVYDKQDLARRIAQVTGLAIFKQRNRFQLGGKPADLIELLDVYNDEVINYR